MAGRVVRVMPEGAGLAKEFDYLVPEQMADRVQVGTLVRIQLGPRRIGGWVVAVGVEPPEGVRLKPIAAVRGHGPDAATIDLCRWAAWRFAGAVAHFLTTASPERAIKGLPAPALATVPAASVPPTVEVAAITGEALAGGVALVRIPPAADTFPVVAAAAALGPALVVCPSHAAAAHIARRLKRAGTPVALVPEQWAEAAAGGRTVVGPRSAAFAPCPGLAAIVVLDAHDEALQSEASPTWSSVVVARERARREQVPCALVTPAPTAVLERVRRHVIPSRKAERDGWPIVEVIDRRDDDPRTGLWSARLAHALERVDSAVLVFNRKGRARLLSCGACKEIQRCERCAAAVTESQPEPDGRSGERPSGSGSSSVAGLTCARCGTRRPRVCQSCGAGALGVLRVGVSRAREEVAALTRRDVAEVTGDSTEVPAGGLVIGTEAVLHRVDRADLVAFVDMDNELLAPRISAAEDALALLVRAARLVGSRTEGGRVLVQTRLPESPALQAAVHADPSRLAAAEADLRQALRFPPFVAMARISGAAAETFVATIDAADAEVSGPVDGRWLVRAPDPHRLADALAKPRPPGKLRIEVDARL